VSDIVYVLCSCVAVALSTVAWKAWQKHNFSPLSIT